MRVYFFKILKMFFFILQIFLSELIVLGKLFFYNPYHTTINDISQTYWRRLKMFLQYIAEDYKYMYV